MGNGGSGPAREAQVALVHDGPDKVLSVLRRQPRDANAALDLFADAEPLPHLHTPAHHEVRASDVLLRRLHATLAAAADRGPIDFAELLLVPGVGARTVASLASVVGREDKLHAIARLDRQARALEAGSRGEAFESVLTRERARSAEYGRRSVLSLSATKRARPAHGDQLRLPGLRRSRSRA